MFDLTFGMHGCFTVPATPFDDETMSFVWQSSIVLVDLTINFGLFRFVVVFQLLAIFFGWSQFVFFGRLGGRPCVEFGAALSPLDVKDTSVFPCFPSFSYDCLWVSMVVL